MIDQAWLAQNWVWVACLAGAAYLWLSGSGKSALAGVKLPPITVKLTDEQLQQLKPKG